MFEFLKRGSRRPEADDTPPGIKEWIEEESGVIYGWSGAAPLPAGMWSELDPYAVAENAIKIREDLEYDSRTGMLPPDLRELLLDGGPAARNLLALLERTDTDESSVRLDESTVAIEAPR